jgi:hypothetical protein
MLARFERLRRYHDHGRNATETWTKRQWLGVEDRCPVVAGEAVARAASRATSAANLFFVLAGGASLASRVPYSQAKTPWPAYQDALASFPVGDPLHLAATIDGGGDGVQPPASFRLWTATGSTTDVCAAVRQAFEGWVDSGTLQVVQNTAVRARGLACDFRGMKLGNETGIEVGASLDSISLDMSGCH